jgi:hypothetical protein
MLTLLFAGLMVACTPEGDRPQTTSPSVPSSDLAPNLATQPTRLTAERFTLDELFAQGGGGCGMTLWHQDDGPRPSGYVFFNGLAQPLVDVVTLMKLNGEFVHFRRIAASGDEFYGQQTSQTFVSPDNAIRLQVNVTLGQPGEIESFAVEGSLQLKHNGETLEIPVLGSAGC